MAKVRWTVEQLDAINKSGTNIIVSAGAGSGKTAVLTERIVEKLINGIDINKLVVLTFTNAAAFEMKSRVRKKIKAKIDEGYEFLKDQLKYLDQATISTFDSFCLNIVKKYHYLLNIESNINVIDNIMLSTKQKEIIDEIFNNLYEEQDKEFLNLINIFTVKDDEVIKLSILSLINKMSSISNINDYIDNYMENYFSDEFIDSSINFYEKVIKYHIDNINGELDILENKMDNDLLIEFLSKVKENIKLLSNVKSYDEIKINIDYINLPQMPKVSKKITKEEIDLIKDNYNNIKQSITSIKELCKYENKSFIKEEIKEMQNYINIILKIIKIFNNNLFKYKTDNNMFCFSDIEFLAIKLLEENEDIRLYYKNNINEIMIDEYQDTNDVGDYLISLIANNNIYMVGDVKQSIYGFRDANPYIFMEKYENYKNNINGVKIDLNKNFRSRSEVLDNINLIFGNIMDLALGGADYNNGHAMVFGNSSYEEFSKENNNLEILNYEKNKKYKDEEIEAFIIGNDIKNKLESKYQVFDGNGLRDAVLSDFCILIDRKTSFDLYKKIFTYLDLPLTVHKDEEFTSSDEIYAINSILKLILSIKDKSKYKKYFNHAFLSLTRSFLCEIDDKYIFDVFNEAKKNNTSILNIIKNENNYFYSLYEILEKLSNEIDILTLQELLKEIYLKFEIYTKINKLGNVEELSIKLDYLLDIMMNLDDSGYSISDVIEYFEYSINNKIDITFNINKNNSNSVNIMTIHKSKGLEFSICYYAGLSKNFSKADLTEKYIYNKKYGLIVPIFNEGIKETIYKELIKYDYNEKDVSEKIRLFYVALTRAKEKMIIVTSLSEDIPKELTYNIKLKYRNFNDMLESIKDKLSKYIRNVDYNIDKKYELNKKINIDRNESNEKLNYKDIDVKKELIVKNNYSVNSLTTVNDNITLGLKIHEYLELIDFKNANEDFIKYNVDEFSKKKILAFLNQDFISNIDNFKIYKEYEFISGIRHGFIDLMLESEDKIIIVDYKLKEIDKSYYKEQILGYKEYINNMSTKIVECYLYSVLDEEYMKVS